MGLFTKLPVYLLCDGLPDLRICLRSHCHNFHFPGHVDNVLQDFSRIEKSSETVGLDGSHERGQSGQETGGKMGTESDKDFYHYFGPLLSMLSTFLYFHLHHESLQCLQLYVYSLGQRFSFPFDTCQLRGEPHYLRLAI